MGYGEGMTLYQVNDICCCGFRVIQKVLSFNSLRFFFTCFRAVTSP